jgi:sRNA-binding protein
MLDLLDMEGIGRGLFDVCMQGTRKRLAVEIRSEYLLNTSLESVLPVNQPLQWGSCWRYVTGVIAIAQRVDDSWPVCFIMQPEMLITKVV